ncbi:MAG: type II secretion system protein [Candidatus Omnitrophota bacterium]
MIKEKRGVTLVEVLFSAGLISFVLIGILMVWVYTVDLSKRVDYEYAATNIAKSRMERIRTVLSTGAGGPGSLVDSLSDLNTTYIADWDGKPDPDGDFKCTTAISSYGSPADDDLARAEVAVIYKYREVWKEDAGATLVTVLNDIE